jgi:hypothetical protein
MAGAPKGNNNASKGKRFVSMIEKRLEELDAMQRIADALIAKALEGDMQAIKEIGDRLDGKAKQQIDLGGQEDNPILTAIEVKLIRPNEANG